MIELGTCPFCGEGRWIDLVDAWVEERAWMLATCCEAGEEDLLEHLRYALELPLHQRARFLRPLRRLFESYGLPFRLAYEVEDGRIRWEDGLVIEDIPPRGNKKRVQSWIRKHHRHNRPPVCWRAAFGAYNGGELVAVALLETPKARRLAERGTILEVSRVCTNHQLPPELTFNASSALYAAAARRAAELGAEKAITYTLEGEEGGSLRAAGWTPEATTRGGSWHRAGRPRAGVAPTTPKVRWAKRLRPAAPAPQLALL